MNNSPDGRWFQRNKPELLPPESKSIQLSTNEAKLFSVYLAVFTNRKGWEQCGVSFERGVGEGNDHEYTDFPLFWLSPVLSEYLEKGLIYEKVNADASAEIYMRQDHFNEYMLAWAEAVSNLDDSSPFAENSRFKDAKEIAQRIVSDKERYFSTQDGENHYVRVHSPFSIAHAAGLYSHLSDNNYYYFATVEGITERITAETQLSHNNEVTTVGRVLSVESSDAPMKAIEEEAVAEGLAVPNAMLLEIMQCVNETIGTLPYAIFGDIASIGAGGESIAIYFKTAEAYLQDTDQKSFPYIVLFTNEQAITFDPQKSVRLLNTVLKRGGSQVKYEVARIIDEERTSDILPPTRFYVFKRIDD